MKLDWQDSTSVLQYAQEMQLYALLLPQLQKDFNLANIDLEFSANLLPKQLVALLREKLYYLMLERFDEYLNLLYVIDVPESAFKAMHMTDAVDVADQVTFLVLKRELAKVYWKMKY